MANNPTLLTQILAEDGDKNTIPATTDATTGLFSEQYGFQSINSLPLTAGGKAPQRNDFNGVFHLLGGIAFYAQKGFVFNFDNSQDYYVGCVVMDPADGKKYECIADVSASNTLPHDDSAHWKESNQNKQMVGATSATNGEGGAVPAPLAGEQGKYLRGDGTWETPPDTTYNNATTAASGLMSAADKTKLDGIAIGANNYSLPSATGSVRGGVTIGSNISLTGDKISVSNQNVQDALGFNPATRTAATQSAAGLMSASDKTKLDGVATGANNYSLPNATSSTLGGVKIGSNITVSSGTISVSSTNVQNALGFNPATRNAVTSSASGLMTPAMLALLGSGGGIVAASLTTNGYVKFADGFIMQWGTVDPAQFPSNGQSVTFPIAFTSTPKVMGMINQNTNSTSQNDLITASLNIYATASNMIAHIYGGVSNTKVKFDWVAVGY